MGKQHLRKTCIKPMSNILGSNCRDGPWPDPTRAYFWPAINKRLACLWPDPKRFFWPERKKIETIDIFRGNLFPNPNPESQKIDPIRLGSGRVSHPWLGFGFGTPPLKCQVFPFGSNQISSGRVKKYLCQRWVMVLFTAGQKKARVGSAPISTLQFSFLSLFSYLIQQW